MLRFYRLYSAKEYEIEMDLVIAYKHLQEGV